MFKRCLIILLWILALLPQAYAQTSITPERITKVIDIHKSILASNLKSNKNCSLGGGSSPLIEMLESVKFERIQALTQSIRQCIGGLATKKGNLSSYKVLAFYNESSDTIYIDPSLSDLDLYITTIHELMHREWSKNHLREWMSHWAMELYGQANISKDVLGIKPRRAKVLASLSPSLINEFISFSGTNCLMSHLKEQYPDNFSQLAPINSKIYLNLASAPEEQLHNLAYKISQSYTKNEKFVFLDFSKNFTRKAVVVSTVQDLWGKITSFGTGTYRNAELARQNPVRKHTPSSILAEWLYATSSSFNFTNAPIRQLYMGRKYTINIEDRMRESLQEFVRDNQFKFHSDRDSAHIFDLVREKRSQHINTLRTNNCLPNYSTSDGENPTGTEGIHNGLDMQILNESYPLIEM